MKKALLVTTVSGFVPQFEMNNVRILQEMGYEVHYASNYHMPSYGNDNSRLDGTGIIRHQVDFERSPFTLKNITVYKQLKKVMEEGQFDLVHCHTPMGGALARIAAHNTKTGPVLYTAHGFHFFKGAPLVNWLCYYPVEKMLSHYTDVLICINQEDYERTKKKFYAKQVIKIPGVGIDIKRIENITVDRNKKREELGIGKDQKVLLFVGEMTKNKNHRLIIEAVAKLHNKNHRLIIEAVAKLHNSNVTAVFCGHGQEEQHLRELAKTLHVEEQIRFLGYRKDVLEIYKIADLFVFPSMREGLPVALIEAMASGLAVVCSKVRGNTDLIDDESVMAAPTDVDGFCKAISKALSDDAYRKELAGKNQKAVQKFDKQNVISIMSQIYRQLG